MRYQPTLNPVDASTGAAIGRAPWLSKPSSRCHLFKIDMDGEGYEANAAVYWGAGQPVWCCTDAESFRYFIRANNRKEAFELVKKEFPHHDVQLKRGVY